MKVLHVYRTYFPDPPGGLQEAIRQICLSTRGYGVENTIFTLSPNPEPSLILRPEARVVRSRSWAAPASCDLGGPAAIATFNRLANEADLIHYLFPWPFGDTLHWLTRPRKPAVLTYISDIVRQQWLGKAYNPIMYKTLHAMQAIVANAPPYVASSPVLSQPDIRRKVSVIPLGIIEDTSPQPNDESVLSRLGLQPGQPFILFIGVLRYYKGLHYLITAAREVNAPIVIAGSGPEGDRLRQQAASSGADNVRFAGQVSDAEKAALLKHCRALVLPSHLRSEAYGMVLVEAAMHRKALISCEIGTGTSFINQHEETGFVVPPAHPDALAGAMNRLISDETLCHAMGAAARSRYETHFSGSALGHGYAEVFRKAVSGYTHP